MALNFDTDTPYGCSDKRVKLLLRSENERLPTDLLLSDDRPYFPEPSLTLALAYCMLVLGFLSRQTD